jgi:hypothetical protein
MAIEAVGEIVGVVDKDFSQVDPVFGFTKR